MLKIAMMCVTMYQVRQVCLDTKEKDLERNAYIMDPHEGGQVIEHRLLNLVYMI